MSYPDTILLSTLERQHPEYVLRLPIYQTIEDLRQGSAVLLAKAGTYLPKRPGEETEVYQDRLQRFVYTPVLPNAIREYCAKLSAAPVQLSTDDEGFWADWQDQIDGKSQDRSAFLQAVFSSLLYFGKVFVAVDLPKSDLMPRSLAEDPGILPYTIPYDALCVPLWGQGWYMTRQLQTLTRPLGDIVTRMQWTFWDETYIARYEADVDIVYDRVAKLDGKRTSRLTLVKRTVLYEHGLGRCPMASLEVPMELWAGNNLHRKQLQYTWVENGWLQAGMVTGLVQRTYRPPAPLPMDDPRGLSQQAVTAEDIAKIRLGNPYVLLGDFSYEESKGTALGALEAQLDKIEQQIRDLLSMGYLSKTANMKQAAEAKDSDSALLQDSMRAYGQRVSRLYQEVLSIAAGYLGRQAPNVKGLDTHSTTGLKEAVDLTVSLVPVAAQIPQETMRIWVSKLSDLLTGTVSDQEAEEIQRQLQALYEDRELDPSNPDDIQQVADALGLSPEEAKAYLGGA